MKLSRRTALKLGGAAAVAAPFLTGRRGAVAPSVPVVFARSGAARVDAEGVVGLLATLETEDVCSVRPEGLAGPILWLSASTTAGMSRCPDAQPVLQPARGYLDVLHMTAGARFERLGPPGSARLLEHRYSSPDRALEAVLSRAVCADRRLGLSREAGWGATLRQMARMGEPLRGAHGRSVPAAVALDGLEGMRRPEGQGSTRVEEAQRCAEVAALAATLGLYDAVVVTVGDDALARPTLRARKLTLASRQRGMTRRVGSSGPDLEAAHFGVFAGLVRLRATLDGEGRRVRWSPGARNFMLRGVEQDLEILAGGEVPPDMRGKHLVGRSFSRHLAPALFA